jgi:UDP-N-acetylmuramoyl-tripeptide--D-alanyl-D-alanine ligase
VIHRLANGAVVVDDSYNSNPAAVERALAAAAAIPGRRRWAVLGDMLELGEGGPEMHRACGELARALAFAPVLGVGALSRSTVAGAGDAGEWQPDAAHAAPRAAELLASGDVVLVKGSRGVGLEVVVQALVAAGSRASNPVSHPANSAGGGRP